MGARRAAADRRSLGAAHVHRPRLDRVRFAAVDVGHRGAVDHRSRAGGGDQHSQRLGTEQVQLDVLHSLGHVAARPAAGRDDFLPGRGEAGDHAAPHQAVRARHQRGHPRSP